MSGSWSKLSAVSYPDTKKITFRKDLYTSKFPSLKWISLKNILHNSENGI